MKLRMPRPPICVTPETERRHVQRRESEMSLHDRAQRYDEVVRWAESQLDFWQERFDSSSSSIERAYAGGRMHAAVVILEDAGCEVRCPCSMCVQEAVIRAIVQI